MGPIGMQELVVILVVVLLIFGPKSLPKLGRSLGSAIREFKDATNKVTESINRLDDEERPAPVAAAKPIAQAAPEAVAYREEKREPVAVANEGR